MDRKLKVVLCHSRSLLLEERELGKLLVVHGVE
jgi:hypothetical protein